MKSHTATSGRQIIRGRDDVDWILTALDSAVLKNPVDVSNGGLVEQV
jgi:hypothetical protein